MYRGQGNKCNRSFINGLHVNLYSLLRWRPSWIYKMVITSQPVFRSTWCLVLGWGFRLSLDFFAMAFIGYMHCCRALTFASARLSCFYDGVAYSGNPLHVRSSYSCRKMGRGSNSRKGATLYCIQSQNRPLAMLMEPTEPLWVWESDTDRQPARSCRSNVIDSSPAELITRKADCIIVFYTQSRAVLCRLSTERSYSN